MIARRTQRWFHYGLLLVLAVFILYPVFYTFSSALMTPAEMDAYPPRLLPGSLYLDNLLTVNELVPVFQFIKNSFIVSTAVMLGQLVTASMAAYAFAFINFKGRNALFALFLSTMMIPWEVTVIPNYITIREWGWLDSYAGLTVPFMATAFGTFLLRQFFLQLPRDLIDAAKIDGCGHWRIFFSLVLPLSRPAIGTLAVYAFLTTWNMYFWPLLITNSDSMRTVQIGISMLQWQEMMAWGLVLAGVAMVLLPSLILLVMGLKQLVRGITAGAVKG
ncbi:carbohydrate ABC transporter permease [Desmospora activa]|uniref:Carbohydrate ABC transporter membrane protein 2 (CUT1 family) n=1 Tax=Desmospora activa DSM 45169 TaxID=1121389 RepID=A0A2T4Z9M3_9BACL|nr:carbohydrate ABC transporter permease [Desmospora activa]PTM58573.1 carbohydrate ABC transporter membrane protein 2 (CUT1 family) [Desmospora activa DSM 45169]